MRLLRIHLENFRSFRDTTIDLDDVTVLVGPNDAGKSSIIEAIRFLLNHDDSGTSQPGSWVDAGILSKPPFHPYDPSGYEMPPGEVVVIGDLGDLTDSEQRRLASLLVDGVVRIGAYCKQDAWGGLFEYRGPCWVLSDPSPLIAGGADPDQPLVMRPLEPPWSHDGNLFVDMGRVELTWRPVLGAPWPPFSGPNVPSLVWLPGPDRQPPTGRLLLEPFVDQVVKRTVEGLAPEIIEALSELALDIEETLSDRLSTIVPEYVPGAISAAVTTTHWDPAGVVRNMFKLNADSTEVYVRRDPTNPEGWDPEDRGRPPGSDPESALGAGARRALALGVLELYGDSELWSADQPVLLALEEPEAGLHPAAQRQVARSLRRLSTKSGLQAIIVTHSPTMIAAMPKSAIRLVRADYDPTVGVTSRVYAPNDFAEIAVLLGARPSDILLADHIVIVEGRSDVAVFGKWARKLGIAIDSSRTILISADGLNKAEAVAKLALLVYPGIRVDMILDGPSSSADSQGALGRHFGSGATLQRLSESEIEAYLPIAAIERWLVAQGSSPDAAGGLEIRRPGPRARSEALNRLTRRAFGRSYRKGSDTGAIAAHAREEEIPTEVSELLIRLLVPHEEPK